MVAERCINHDWRRCKTCVIRVRSNSWRRGERERERRGTTLSARVSRVLMYVRVLVGAKPLSRNDHVSLQPFPLDLPLWCKFARGSLRGRGIPTTRPRVSSPVKLTNEIAGPLASIRPVSININGSVVKPFEILLNFNFKYYTSMIYSTITTQTKDCSLPFYSSKRNILVASNFDIFLSVNRIESCVKRWIEGGGRRVERYHGSKEWKNAFPEEGSSTQGSANPRSDSRCSFFPSSTSVYAQGLIFE